MADQVIAEYIQKINLPWQADVCTRLDGMIHEAVPEVESRIQYGKPHYLKRGKYAAVVGTAKGWVAFTIFNAAALNAPAGLFEDGDPARKTVKIREGQAVNFDLLGKLLAQAANTI